jgi:hypothetical protein
VLALVVMAFGLAAVMRLLYLSMADGGLRGLIYAAALITAFGSGSLAVLCLILSHNAYTVAQSRLDAYILPASICCLSAAIIALLTSPALYRN